MILDMAAKSHGDRLAMGTRTAGLTYAELDRAAAGGATLIRAAGARSVAFLGLNGPAVPAVLFAAARAAAPACPLNYRLAADQIADLLDQLEAPYLIVDRSHLDLVPDRPVQIADEWLPAALAASATDTDAPADDSPAVLLFTSGTTAAPKAALLRHENLVSYVLQTVEFAAADESDAILVSVPPYHVAGVGAALTNVYSGPPDGLSA